MARNPYARAVHLAHLRLRNFRNYSRLDLDFEPGIHLILGNNAQGKTNILEAVYLLATARSFRGAGHDQMVRHGATGYFVGGRILGQGERLLKFFWSPKEKAVSVNGNSVRKYSDFLGLLRAVVFCTEDLQLVKGAPAHRRRLLDLLLSQTDPGYLLLLGRYRQALRSRNALLKQRAFDPAALEGFTKQLIDSGSELTKRRRELLPQFEPLARESYRRLSNSAEELSILYQPSVKNDFALELGQMRAREKSFGSTLIGPHRDELQFLVNGRAAEDFASEGQKRSIVIALKLAQAEYLSALYGAPPVLLIDDIMGELDRRRRAAFIPLLDRARAAHSQVFMTCTEENWPAELARQARRWEVAAGEVKTGG